MIFIQTGQSVIARASSSDDLVSYLNTNSWNYIACDYFNSQRPFPSKWFFSDNKEELLTAVFELNKLEPVYRLGRWHLEGLNAEKFGAMVYTDWGEHPVARKILGPDTDRATLVDAFWTYAQVMDSFMSLVFFGPVEELIESRCRSLSVFIENQAWRK